VTPGKQAWNDWDVPYFGGPLPDARPDPAPAVAEIAPETSPAVVLELAGGGVRTGQRILALLIAIGAPLAGVAVTGFLLVISFVLSFGSPADGGEWVVAAALGGLVAIIGWLLAFVTYRDAGRLLRAKLDGGQIEITYNTFKAPFVVPRTSVRVVAVDAAPSRMFTNNKRFPIAGSVPPDMFADALDNLPAGPWDDLDPERRGKRYPSPEVIREDAATSHVGYSHDDPDRKGWASATSGGPALAPPREAYLWSAAGSSLPFLRVGPGDVPNVALVFDEPQRTPRPPWWFDLSPLHGRFHYFRGGRRVRGLLLRVADPSAAEQAFARWGLLRQITADDVVEEGLLIAKPLAGRRAIAYAVMVIVPLLADLIFRHLR